MLAGLRQRSQITLLKEIIVKLGLSDCQYRFDGLTGEGDCYDKPLAYT